MHIFRTSLLLSVSVFILCIECIITVTTRVKDYGVEFWRNNAMRKWVFASIDCAETCIHGVGDYLENLQTRLQCRIAYDKISTPMKRSYRELKARGRSAGRGLPT